MFITTTGDLKLAILELEEKKAEQKKNLVIQLQQTCESLKPVNVLKNSLHEITSGPGLGGKVLNAALGVSAGMLSKKIMIGPSANILLKMVGAALEFGVAGMVVKNGRQIKTGIGGLLKKLLRKPVVHVTNQKFLSQ